MSKKWDIANHAGGWGNSITLAWTDNKDEDKHDLSWITQEAPKEGDTIIGKDGTLYSLIKVKWAGSNPGDLYFVTVKLCKGKGVAK